MSYKVFHIVNYWGNSNKNFLGFHVTPVTMAKMKNTMVNAVEDVRKADTSSWLVHCKGVCVLCFLGKSTVMYFRKTLQKQHRNQDQQKPAESHSLLIFD